MVDFEAYNRQLPARPGVSENRMQCVININNLKNKQQ
jgi:hypothetical protein